MVTSSTTSGPNVVALERRHGFPPQEFRLWIALHEVTHRLQFTGVPWMREHFLGLVERGAALTTPDTKAILEACAGPQPRSAAGNNPLAEGGIVGLLATSEQLATLREAQALMSLLEGHGDVVMSRAGQQQVPGAAAVRRGARRSDAQSASRRRPGSSSRCSGSRRRCASTPRASGSSRKSSGPAATSCSRSSGEPPRCSRAWRRSGNRSVGSPGSAGPDTPGSDRGVLSDVAAGLLPRCTFPPAGEPLACAVSGGADSLALLVLAVAAGCRVDRLPRRPRSAPGLRRGGRGRSRGRRSRSGAGSSRSASNVPAGPEPRGPRPQRPLRRAARGSRHGPHR